MSDGELSSCWLFFPPAVAGGKNKCNVISPLHGLAMTYLGCSVLLRMQSLTGMRTCEGLLAALLDVTESTFGFIASNARLPDASPCLKVSA